MDLPICLCTLTCARHQHTEIWTHSRVNDANVGTYYGHLLDHRIVDEYGRGFLLCRDYYAVGSCGNGYEYVSLSPAQKLMHTLDSETCRPRRDSCKSMFDLDKLTAR